MLPSENTKSETKLPELLAFCSRDTNKISIVETQTTQTWMKKRMKKHMVFDGVQLKNIGTFLIFSLNIQIQ